MKEGRKKQERKQIRKKEGRNKGRKTEVQAGRKECKKTRRQAKRQKEEGDESTDLLAAGRTCCIVDLGLRCEQCSSPFPVVHWKL